MQITFRCRAIRAVLCGSLALFLGACSPDDGQKVPLAEKSVASELAEKSVASELEETARPLTEASIRQIYWRSCHSCHGSGVSGAPRTGDTAAWAPRLAKGTDTLVTNAMNGFRAMPPRGLCFDCSREEFAALIQMMSRPSGVEAIE